MDAATPALAEDRARAVRVAAAPGLRRGRRAKLAPLLGQIGISVSSLLVGLALARGTAAEDYGLYVLCMAVIMYVVGVQDALVAVPTTVRAARIAPRLAQRYFRHAGTMSFLAVSAVCAGLLCIAALAAAFGWGGWQTWAGCGIAVGLWSAWDFSRSCNLAEGRYRLLLRSDALYLALLATGIGAGYWRGTLDSATALFIHGGAALGAWWASGFRLRLPHSRRRGVRRLAALLWRRGRASLAGAQAGWLQSQGYIFLTGALLDLRALAVLGGTRLLVAPVMTFVTAWSKVSLPQFSRFAAAGHGEHVRRYAFVSGVALAAFACAVGLAAWLGADWVGRVVFNGRLGETGEFSLLWGGVVAATALRSVASVALRGAGLFSLVSRVYGLGALLSMAGCLLGILLAGGQGALAGLIVAESVAAVMLIAFLLRHTGRRP